MAETLTLDGEEGDQDFEADEVQLKKDMWADVPDFPADFDGVCMVTRKSHKWVTKWAQKVMYVSRGIVYWRKPQSKSECRDMEGSKAPNMIQRFRSRMGKVSSLSLRLASSVESLTREQVTGVAPPSLAPHCLKIGTSFSSFIFCFEGKTGRNYFSEALEKHRAPGRKGASELVDLAGKAQRLTSFALTDTQVKQMDDLGQAEVMAMKNVIEEGTKAEDITDAEIQAQIIANLPGDADSRAEASAILERFRNGTKLLQQAPLPVGEEGASSFMEMQEAVAEGQRLMQQAFHDALSNEALSHYMHGAGGLEPAGADEASAASFPVWAQVLLACGIVACFPLIF